MAATTTRLTRSQNRRAIVIAGDLLDGIAERLRDVDEDLLPAVVRELRSMLRELDLETLPVQDPSDPE